MADREWQVCVRFAHEDTCALRRVEPDVPSVLGERSPAMLLKVWSPA